MTDNEIKEKCLQEAGIDLGRYSYTELTEIKDALRRYHQVKLKLLSIADVSGSASDFYDDLMKLINAHCKKGLSKPDLVAKMKYATDSCIMS